MLAATGTLGVAGFAGCTGLLGEDGEFTVGSKDFTEQHVLANLSITVIDENTDLETVNESGLGGTLTNFESLSAGDIDHYWEYTGTMRLALPPEETGEIPPPEELYEEQQQVMDEEHDFAVLEPTPFNNTYVITASEEFWEEEQIESLSELAEFANAGNADELEPVLGPEFQERPDDGWPALLDHYGFDEEAQETINDNVVTVDEDVVYAAVGEEGEGNIGMGFATDPRIIEYNFHIFDDDESFFPTYNAAPMVRNDTLEQFPEIEDELNEIPHLLDNETMGELNRLVATEGRDVGSVAEEFLEEHGII